MNIFGLKLLTTYPVTILELESGSSFRLADSYENPDASPRKGMVVNAQVLVNIGVGRQVLSINKSVDDTSLFTLYIAVLTNRKIVAGKFTFPLRSPIPGQATLKIGKPADGLHAIFTTSDPSNAIFSFKVDESWGRLQNETE